MTSPGGVTLLTLGGTIAMSGQDADGVVTRLGGHELIAGLGDGDPPVRVHDLQAVPSSNLSFADVLDAVEAADDAVRQGADGVVLTQGTDSLEETAFLIDAVWTRDAPFVVTGAMRNPTLPGADGPANVLASIRVAATPDARGRGALVVFHDEVHAARFVRKTHSTSPSAFASPDLGPVGHVIEGRPRLLARTPRPTPIAVPSRDDLARARIAHHTTTFDDDGVLLGAVAGTHHGLVVATFGAGHVPGALVPVLSEIAAAVPVVLTSRTGGGWVLTDTYGSPGSERDLLDHGLVNGGRLHPLKARVLLRLLVAGGADLDDIAAAFAAFGGS